MVAAGKYDWKSSDDSVDYTLLLLFPHLPLKELWYWLASINFLLPGFLLVINFSVHFF
jgi:hypothetical protein